MSISKQSAYGAKLLDIRWRNLAEEIKVRDKHTCLLCGDQTNTLHVHHDFYVGDPWTIPKSALRTVCCHCHEMLHTFPKEILRVKKVFIEYKQYKLFTFTLKGVRLCRVQGEHIEVDYTLSYLDVDLIYNNKLI